MEIAILQLLEGARQARGAAVIIDVFRAYSVECYGFAQGLRRIYPVGDLEEARRLKAARPEYLLCGEREGRKQPGCDFGNSPLEIAKQDLTGRVLIHTTSAGTQGLENAKGADFLLAASLVNAKATAEYFSGEPGVHGAGRPPPHRRRHLVRAIYPRPAAGPAL